MFYIVCGQTCGGRAMALHNQLIIIIKCYFHEKDLYNCFVQSGPNCFT